MIFFDPVAGVKIKQATSVAGEVAKTASSSVAEAAERAGTVVRSRWSLLQQQQSKDGGPTVQERWRSASTVLKKNLLETKEKVAVGLQDTKEKVVIGLSDTKEKVAIGRVKVEEVRYSYFEPLDLNLFSQCCLDGYFESVLRASPPVAISMSEFEKHLI